MPMSESQAALLLYSKCEPGFQGRPVYAHMSERDVMGIDGHVEVIQSC